MSRLSTATRRQPAAKMILLDRGGIRHAVEATASLLYDAAALMIDQFRRYGFTADAPGPATRLTVTVTGRPRRTRSGSTRSKRGFRAAARSPAEQALKVMLRELLGA